METGLTLQECSVVSVNSSLLGLSLLLFGDPFVLFSDFIELLDVLVEVLVSLKSNEQFGFLALSSVALDCDSLGSDLFESSILVSTQVITTKEVNCYLTRFSAAITAVDTAFPKAWSSMVSCSSKYFLPKKT